MHVGIPGMNTSDERQSAGCDCFRRLLRAAACAAVMLWQPFAAAQDMEPRSYSNIPVGLNFLIAGYAYSDGGVSADPSVLLDNAELTLHGLVFAYARSLDLWGRSGKCDVILPYGWTSGSAESNGVSYDHSVNGLANPRFRFSMNLFGAPALSLREYRDYKQDLVGGFSVQVQAPMSQYNGDRLLNLGTNRWSVKPEAGVSKEFGPSVLELSAGVRVP
jgi:hypothetical protein